MTTHAQPTFSTKSWDEKPYLELEDGSKFTRCSVTNNYLGALEGESTLEYTMFYRSDGSGVFIGLERVVGKLGGRVGSFVLQHNGAFAGPGIKAHLTIVPDSGTEELRGLRGEGSMNIEGQHERYPITLEYELP